MSSWRRDHWRHSCMVLLFYDWPCHLLAAALSSDLPDWAFHKCLVIVFRAFTWICYELAHSDEDCARHSEVLMIPALYFTLGDDFFNWRADDWQSIILIYIGKLKLGRGLEYLHEHCNPPVIHRDLKSSNILLDSDFNAKVHSFNFWLRSTYFSYWL
jgi:hypothetical protein